MNKFDEENLFPQNYKNGQEAASGLIQPHLKTIRRLGFNSRIYDCRHTFAISAVENGIDLVVSASVLGHSDLKMVMRHALSSEASKAEAIRKMKNGNANAV